MEVHFEKAAPLTYIDIRIFCILLQRDFPFIFDYKKQIGLE